MCPYTQLPLNVCWRIVLISTHAGSSAILITLRKEDKCQYGSNSVPSIVTACPNFIVHDFVLLSTHVDMSLLYCLKLHVITS